MLQVRARYNHWLPKKLGAAAITLYPFVLFHHDSRTAFVNHFVAHEAIHVRQIRELGWFRFYWRYVKEYLSLRLTGLDHDMSYNAISFEAEAHDFEKITTLTAAEFEEFKLFPTGKEAANKPHQ